MRNKNNNLNFIYRGKVVSNKDPKSICRIKVRVPSVHGSSSDDGISDNALPYAMPCTMWASYDAGTFLVPEVGSTVFVFFEGGESNKPIYIGSSISNEHTDALYFGDSDSNEFVNSEGTRLKKAYLKDTPSNVYRGGIFRKFILFKSKKGSSIEFCDEDNNEHLSIIDRLGQCLFMHSPVSESDNSYGMSNRGVFSILKSSTTIVQKALLILKSLSSSFLRFISDPDYSNLDLINVYKDKNAGISINIGTTDRVLIHYNNKSLIELTEGKIKLQSDVIEIKGDLKVQGSIESTSKIQGDVYGQCPCTGTNGYAYPASLNLDDIASFEDSKDEYDIDE